MNATSVTDLVSAYRSNPQALQQRYAMSQDLLDLMALQKLTKEKQDAARQMQLQSAQQGTPPPIAQQLEGEALDMTKQEIAQQNAGLATQRAQQTAGAQGLAGLQAPNIAPAAFNGGGIVGFSGGGETPSADSVRANRQRKDPQSVTDERIRIITAELKKAQAAGNSQDVAALMRELGTLGVNLPGTPPRTQGLPALTAQDRSPAKLTNPDKAEIVLAAYNAAIASGNKADADEASAELDRLGGARGVGAGRGVVNPAPSVNTKQVEPQAFPTPAAGASPRPGVQSDAFKKAEAFFASSLNEDPLARRQMEQEKYDTEYGTGATAALQGRVDAQNKGLEALQAAQKKRLEAGTKTDQRPEWLRAVSAMANAPYDPKSAPAGLAGLSMVNRGTADYIASNRKREQDQAQLELDFVKEVQDAVRAGYTQEDAVRAVAQGRYAAGESGEKEAFARKGAAAEREYTKQTAIDQRLNSPQHNQLLQARIALQSQLAAAKVALDNAEKNKHRAGGMEAFKAAQNQVSAIEDQLGQISNAYVAASGLPVAANYAGQASGYTGQAKPAPGAGTSQAPQSVAPRAGWGKATKE